MELRYHPLISYRGRPSWPPVWSPTRPREGKQSLKGEVGVLTDIMMGPSQFECFLIIEHENKPYIGCLFLTDPGFCTQLAAILREKFGFTIKDIGDLDLSFTL